MAQDDAALLPGVELMYNIALQMVGSLLTPKVRKAGSLQLGQAIISFGKSLSDEGVLRSETSAARAAIKAAPPQVLKVKAPVRTRVPAALAGVMTRTRATKKTAEPGVKRGPGRPPLTEAQIAERDRKKAAVTSRPRNRPRKIDPIVTAPTQPTDAPPEINIPSALSVTDVPTEAAA